MCYKLLFLAILFGINYGNCLIINYNGTEPSLLQLYNMKTGRFLAVRLISDIPPTHIIQKDLGKSNRYTGITESTNFMSTNRKMNSETELQVRLGLVRANAAFTAGSDAWNKNSARSVQGYIIISQATVSEEIYVCHRNLSGLIPEEFLNPGLFEATHVLIRKDYGMEVSVTITDENSTNEDKEQVTAGVKAGIEVALKGSLDFKGSYSQDKSSSSTQSSLKVHVKSNIKTGLNVPKTVEAVPQFLDGISAALKETNAGKGVAMTYEVEDIEIVRKCFNSKYKSEIGGSTKKHLSEEKAAILNRYLQTQDEFTNEISDWLQDVHDFRKCLPGFEAQGVPLLQFEVQNFSLHYRESLRTLYLDVFSTQADVNDDKFNALTASLKDSVNSPEYVLNDIKVRYGGIKEKLMLFRVQELRGIKCFPVGGKRHLLYTEGFQAFFRYNSTNINDDDLTVGLRKFQDRCRILKARQTTTCFIVDCHYIDNFTVCEDFESMDMIYFDENGKFDEKLDFHGNVGKHDACKFLANFHLESQQRYKEQLKRSGSSNRYVKEIEDYIKRAKEWFEYIFGYAALYGNNKPGKRINHFSQTYDGDFCL